MGHELAATGEALVVDELVRRGWRIIERNYHYGHGEIDIIAFDGDVTVFVEVKTRTSASFGAPEYSITSSKQKQIIKIARGYIFERQLTECACRFDVVTVEFLNGVPRFNHIHNAFQA